ncbi:M60 family metallopeptidase [Akkermansiaceae bacterium]|nr:M60 family metallopeptidase [Akkermansiaceae bacterium]MDB4429577.1 M60 family metallopeptidase [Akkermansiaceae bacterium]
MIKRLTLLGGISLILSCSIQAGVTDLLNAYTGLKNHINGTATLTAAQLTARGKIVRENKNFAGNTAASITASLDLVTTYQNQAAPIFSDEFSRTPDSNVFRSLRLAMVEVHQAIIDDVYNATNLANHRTLLDGFKFESADKFPGQITGPSNTTAIYSVQINASQPEAYGYAVDYSTEHARRPTGAYLTPGRIATVTVPANLVGKGYRVRVGAHVHDLQNRPNNLKRFDRVTRTYPINNVATEIASPLGGGIYIEVPYEVEEGLATIQFQNTVRAPFFSNTVARQTTLTEWRNTERGHPGPWTDFETDKFMMTIPTAWIYNFSDPVTLMNNWDLAMDACSDLQGLPRVRPKTVLYCIIDVTLKANAFSPGYPQSNDNFDPTPSNPYNGNQNHDYLNGPQVTDEVDFHEFGHASSINKFNGETESIVNLFAVPVLNRMFNVPLEEAFGKSLNYDTNGRMNRKDAAINWAVHAKFRSGQPMTGDEMKYQHRGYGKYVEIAALFGWDALQAFWSSVADDAEIGILYSKNSDPADSRIIRMSNAANANLLPLIHFWGVHPDDATVIQEKLDYQGIKASPAIYDRLKFYQSVIPMNASQFSAHRNRISGLMSVNDQPNYEIWKNSWSAAMGQQSVNRIQNIIDLYFPDGRPVEPLPHYEDFEDGIGGWAQATNDNYEWRHNTGPTMTGNAGPDAAAGGEYYMYAEGHDATGSNKTSSFQCTFDFSTVQPTDLSFDYHMYGPYIDFLAVDIHDGTSWTNNVWVKNGQQQTSSSDPWSSASIDLTSYTGNDEVMVRFRTKNLQWNAADPAIDNVRIDVPLPTPPLADSFEGGLGSSWVKSTGADYFFVVNSGGTSTGAAGPSGASDGNKYIYAEGHHGINGFKKAGIERSFDFSNASDVELSFDYHMYGTYIDFLAVDIHDGTQWIEDVWRKNGQQQNSSSAPWQSAKVNLSAYSGLPRVTVCFRTGNTRWAAADPAIDNFALSATVGGTPPVADDLVTSVNQGNSVGILLSGSNSNGGTLSYTVVTPPSNGTLSGSAPALSYTPNGGFLGTETFTYIANDGALDSAPATVSISVHPSGFVFFTDFGNAVAGNVNASDMDAVSSSGGSWNVNFDAAGNHAFVANTAGTDHALVVDSAGGTGSPDGNHATLELDSDVDFSSPLSVEFDLGAARGGNGKTFAVTGYGPDDSSVVFQFSFDFQNYPVQVLTSTGMQSLSPDYFIFAAGGNPYDPDLLKTFSVVLDGTSVSYGAEGLTPVEGSIPNSQTLLSSIKWEITGGVTAAQGFWLDNVSVDQEPAVETFSSWASGFGLTGANAATTAEHENGGTGDGYSNFVEYALGMDPTVVDSPYGEIVVRDTGFSVDFSRRKLDGVEVVLEWSSSLVGQWSTDGVTETVMSDDGDFEGIRATVPMDADKKFVRIRVTE